MKKLYFFFALCISSCNSNGQTTTNDTFVVPDFDIGNYGVSLKDNAIGRLENYDCGDGEYTATCAGYFKADGIDFNTTTVVFSGDEVSFIEDITLDEASLKVIKFGYKSLLNSYDEEGLYIDKFIAATNLSGTRVIDSLRGYTHLAKQFLINGDSLGYLDNYGFYKLSDSHKIDIDSFTPIINNLFYDKNGVYYVEYGYSTVEDQKFSDIIKLQDLVTNKKPSITITDHYYIINNTVYDARRVKNVLLLDPKNINQLILKAYSGEMLLFDDAMFYDKPYATYSFDEALCDTDYEKTQIQCLFNDVSTLKKLRETRYTDYHLDKENKTLYFNANKDLELTEVSGSLYSIDGHFYFYDAGEYSLKLERVNIWNPAIAKVDQIRLKKLKIIADDVMLRT